MLLVAERQRSFNDGECCPMAFLVCSTARGVLWDVCCHITGGCFATTGAKKRPDCHIVLLLYKCHYTSSDDIQYSAVTASCIMFIRFWNTAVQCVHPCLYCRLSELCFTHTPKSPKWRYLVVSLGTNARISALAPPHPQPPDPHFFGSRGPTSLSTVLGNQRLRAMEISWAVISSASVARRERPASEGADCCPGGVQATLLLKVLQNARTFPEIWSPSPSTPLVQTHNAQRMMGLSEMPLVGVFMRERGAHISHPTNPSSSAPPHTTKVLLSALQVLSPLAHNSRPAKRCRPCCIAAAGPQTNPVLQNPVHTLQV